MRPRTFSRRNEHDTISTHAPLARCDIFPSAPVARCRISTHAPLARCDCAVWRQMKLKCYFNSRTSCEVRRRPVGADGRMPEFQLTHLLRGATRLTFYAVGNADNFNSRTSCEVRLFAMLSCNVCCISTHAPLARCDGEHIVDLGKRSFISTHAPLARCDWSPDHPNANKGISTHAPLARCDRNG